MIFNKQYGMNCDNYEGGGGNERVKNDVEFEIWKKEFKNNDEPGEIGRNE